MAFKEEIIITAQDQASPEIGKAAAAMENVNNLLSVEKLKEYSDAVYEFATKTMSEFVNLAMIQQKAELALESALSSTTRAVSQLNITGIENNNIEKERNIIVQETLSKYKALASSLQEKSVLGDEDILQAAAMIQSNKNLAGSTEEYVKILPDLAAKLELATGKQFNAQSAALQLIMGVEGSSREFRKLGIELKNSEGNFIGAEAAIKLLSEAAGNANETLVKSDLGIRQTANAWGDFKELIGFEVLPVVKMILSDFLLPVVQWLNSTDPALKAFIAKTLLMSAAIAGGVSVIAGFSLAITAIGTAAATTAAYFAGITAAAWALYEALDYLFELINVNAALQGFFEMFMNYEGATIDAGAARSANNTRQNKANRIYTSIVDLQDEEEFNIAPLVLDSENLFG